MNRLNPFFLFRGHWKSLGDYRAGRVRGQFWIRVIVLVVPVALGLWIFFAHGKLADPSAMLAALGLLAGALLAAFAQLATWRLRLTEREEAHKNSERIDRDHLDETAAQLLVASYSSATAALFLVLGMNFSADKHGAISGVWAALAVVAASHVILVFLVAVPRLYSSYVTINGVRDELSGYSSSRRHQ
ncbi:hypothetical protein ASE16_08090 [Leifsonia sp. Root227]|uniref:hypothetical protein n=1 Tax=Leifsonia sp. Root227 TaxID=1736496 RepID=UPI0006F6B9EC|nr:hypothetical protein [Leifsonia sp. Root227]KRC50909.1 hypothetical protein ASE16_08090 [Leifsonia sp. Root227]